MNVAYVDTSPLIAVAFNEAAGESIARRLRRYERLISSNLLEAELRATFRRENVRFDASLMSSIEWILPHRPLSAELSAVLSTDYLRGADLWHLATALYTVGTADPGAAAEISFITLDTRQRQAAATLGFQI